jgi:hypothetical protein
MSGQLHAPAALPPGKESPETGWAPEPVWTTWRNEYSWSYRDSNSDLLVVQHVANRYTDYATTGYNKFLPQLYLVLFKRLSILFRHLLRVFSYKSYVGSEVCYSQMDFVFVSLSSVLLSSWGQLLEHPQEIQRKCMTTSSSSCGLWRTLFWLTFTQYTSWGEGAPHICPCKKIKYKVVPVPNALSTAPC